MNEPGELLSKLLDSGLGYFWFVALAVWGGTINYMSRLKKGKVDAFSFAELVGEWSVSGFAGILTAYICAEIGFSWHMTAFFTAIAGHQGGRSIHLLESYAKRRFPGLCGKIEDRSDDDHV